MAVLFSAACFAGWVNGICAFPQFRAVARHCGLLSFACYRRLKMLKRVSNKRQHSIKQSGIQCYAKSISFGKAFPISSFTTKSAMPSSGVGVRLMMTSAAPDSLANSGNEAAG